MILVSPAYLSLLALAAGIVLLYFLHTRRQRHEVSALFLWEQLPNDPRTRAARIRIRIDAKAEIDPTSTWSRCSVGIKFI